MFRLRVTSPATLDAKGRVKLPSTLLKQLGEGSDSDFILKLDDERGILRLYPIKVWNELEDRLNNELDPFNPDHEDFMSLFFLDIREVSKDTSDRINIPNYMIDAVGLKGEVMVHAYQNKIEIWPLHKYEERKRVFSADYRDLSRKIFTSKSEQGGGS